jgi:hypothetical protein
VTTSISAIVQLVRVLVVGVVGDLEDNLVDVVST